MLCKCSFLLGGMSAALLVMCLNFLKWCPSAVLLVSPAALIAASMVVVLVMPDVLPISSGLCALWTCWSIDSGHFLRPVNFMELRQ